MVKVIVIGAGYGGLDTVLRLRDLNKEVEITLINKFANFVHQAALYKLVSGRIKPKKLKFNLSKVCSSHNIRFYEEEVVHVKPLEKAVITMSRKLSFDYLVIACGSVTNYYGIDGMKEYSYSLKSVMDGIKINKKIIEEVEKSKLYKEPIDIIVIGGGLTGSEVAAEIASFTKNKANVIILDSQKIMTPFGAEVIDPAKKILEKLGVQLKSGKVKRVSEGKVILDGGEELYSGLIIWCGGVKPNPLTHKCGLRTNERGGLMINDYLQTSHPHIYSLGDCSYMYKTPQPQTAQMATIQAKVAAYNIDADITKKDKKTFIPSQTPYLITFGRRKAILVDKKKIKAGWIQSLKKEFVEFHYSFTRKHWIWPIKKFELK